MREARDARNKERGTKERETEIERKGKDEKRRKRGRKIKTRGKEKKMKKKRDGKEERSGIRDGVMREERTLTVEA